MGVRGIVTFLGALFVAYSAQAEGVIAPMRPAFYFTKNDLHKKYQLHVSYLEQDGLHRFYTSRTRIVRFTRSGPFVEVLEDSANPVLNGALVARLPIVKESDEEFVLDFDQGFNRVYSEEDRSGQDYNGRNYRVTFESFLLENPYVETITSTNDITTIVQSALREGDKPIKIFYFIKPYASNPLFKSQETNNLKGFGFYETYPQLRQGGGTTLHLMKFGIQKPISFAISDNTPIEYREAIRDGVLYWNKAFGRKLVQVQDAPVGVRAPSAQFNVIQWMKRHDFGATSHIQGDQTTGEIKHAHIFLPEELAAAIPIKMRPDYWRYIVAHEVGHALGLRHNYHSGPITTVMNYFNEVTVFEIGQHIADPDAAAFEYDTKVMRHIYLGEDIDLENLPPFCTDSHNNCPISYGG